MKAMPAGKPAGVVAASRFRRKLENVARMDLPQHRLDQPRRLTALRLYGRYSAGDRPLPAELGQVVGKRIGFPRRYVGGV
jgi:hypothetical protein